MADPSTIIADLRRHLGLSQLEFGARIGLANKASVSLLERGLAPCSLEVALRIEELSGGQIDAAQLNDGVRLARGAARIGDPANADAADRQVICIECDQPFGGTCPIVSCPHFGREAA